MNSLQKPKLQSAWNPAGFFLLYQGIILPGTGGPPGKIKSEYVSGPGTHMDAGAFIL